MILLEFIKLDIEDNLYCTICDNIAKWRVSNIENDMNRNYCRNDLKFIESDFLEE